MNNCLTLAADCCGTLTDRHKLKEEVQALITENESLKLQVAMLKRHMAKVEKIDRFGKVERVEWPEDRADIIGQNGNDGEHYDALA